MNPATLAEAKRLFAETKRLAQKSSNINLVIFPPTGFLGVLRSSSPKMKLGAQNCHWEEKGAFTGEVSAKQLRSLGCGYVILGHSERRQYFKETDEIINLKIKAALKNKLKIVFCVGETKKEKDDGRTQEVLIGQIQRGLKGVKKGEIKNILLAYEPAWAIGSGLACGADEAQVMHLFLRRAIAKNYSVSVSQSLPVLYGGSVNQKNVKDYIWGSGMSGIILGGGSLDTKELGKIVKNIN